MAQKLIISIGMVITLGVFIVNFFYPWNDEKLAKNCVSQILAQNRINGILLISNKNQIILNGQVNKSTKTKIKSLSFTQCGKTKIIDELTLSDNINKHQAWVQFEIDKVNDLILVHGKVKNQTQIKEILTIFAKNFPYMKLVHDIDLDVLINRNNPLSNHLTYLLPSIDSIKVAQIKLTENTLLLKGLVRDVNSEYLVINTLKRIFTDEVKIKNNLEKVIKNNYHIKPLEFSLDTIPPLENNLNNSTTMD